jgi:integrase
MASVRKRPNGSFEVVWREPGPNGTRVQRTRTFQRHAEARAYADSRASLVERRGVGDPDRQTVRAFLTRWIDFLRDRGELSPTTLAGYQRHIDKACEVIGEIPISKLSAVHLDQLYSRLLKEGGRRWAAGHGPLTPRTVKHVHRMLHTAFARAVRWDLIPDNPVARASPPAAPDADVRAFTAEEVTGLLAAAEADPELYCIVATLLITGIRRSELAGLAFDAVDLERGVIFIHRAVVEVVGHVPLLRDQVKTHRSKRPLSIPPTLVELLRAQKRRVAEAALAWGPQYQRTPLFVFPGPGGEPMRPMLITIRLRQLLTQARITGASPVHSWRHTAATLLVGEGVDAKTVATRLGHSTPAITLRLYVHPQDHLDRAAADRLGALLPARKA